MNTIQMLKSGLVVVVDGIKLKKDDTPLCVGDLYVGERNTGPHLLEVEKIIYYDPVSEGEIKHVVPSDPFAYSYDGWEVVKVKEGE